MGTRHRLSVVCEHCLAANAGYPPAAIPQRASASNGRFSGKACVVTGGASGVGRAAAEQFVREGCNVLLVDIDSSCEETARSLNGLGGGGRALSFVGDVSLEADNRAMVNNAVENFGRLDIFFANAGILPPWGDVQESTADSFEKVLKVNLIGPFLAIKYASMAMKDAGIPGSIVITTSIAALRADMAPLEYHASKAGILGIVRAAQDQLIPHGIRVNCVAPGGVNTPMVTKVPMALYQKGLKIVGADLEKYPLSEPDEIAKVVLFLASDDASAIRGQCIVADKGYTNNTGIKAVPIKKKLANAP